ALMPLLASEPRFTEVIGLDIQPPVHPMPGVTYHQVDVRSRRMAHYLDGADLLIHLAFVIFHRGDRKQAEEINIDGSIQTFEMAARRGVKRIVAASSHTVYGAHPDNPIPITEDWPLRGNEELHYAWSKRLVEEYLDTFELRYPGIRLIRLRPCTVWGPSIPQSRAQLFLSSLALSSKRYDAPIQLLHEADVAKAFVSAALEPDAVGIYNVAPRDWVRPSELRRLLDIRAAKLPGMAVRLLNSAMWRLNLTELSPEWLILARHPVVLSSQRICQELGWSPTRSTVETARETVASMRGESFAFEAIRS
ncbi:MAG: NAD-dependent epimerase/dehydratase family protein, partial [Myxococcales bacterium]|nr:NAD-dependent epimerase/dehydratase family protein [Myxococcales bacterium]